MNLKPIQTNASSQSRSNQSVEQSVGQSLVAYLMSRPAASNIREHSLRRIVERQKKKKRYYWFIEAELHGIPIKIARAGWSAERGYEIYLDDRRHGTAGYVGLTLPYMHVRC